MQQPTVAATATPRPWVVHFDEPHIDGGGRHYIVEDTEGHQLMLVLRLPEVSQREHDANVALFIAATNERDGLIRQRDALRDALRAVHTLAHREANPDAWDLREIVDAALARAGSHQ